MIGYELSISGLCALCGGRGIPGRNIADSGFGMLHRTIVEVNDHRLRIIFSSS